MEVTKKKYFKNLDGLRFIAASMVVIMHCYFFAYGNKATTETILGHYFQYTGGYGVKLFFVLSGFLITYLLLQEQKNKRKINVKNFYIRRILRIWPLYFLVGIGGTLAAPVLLNALGIPFDNGFTFTNLLYVFTFSINLQLVFDTFNRGIVEILWSVCIEEQFYLIWPLLIIIFRKHLLFMLVATTIIGVLTPFYITYFGNPDWNMARYFFTTSAFTMFGGGGIMGYWLINKQLKPENIIYQKWAQCLVLTLCIGVCFNIIPFINSSLIYKYYLTNIVSTALFSLLIVQLVNEKSILNLEYKWLKIGGVISYGIYVYHTFVAQVIIKVLPKIGIPLNSVFYELFCPILVLFISCVVSYISYYTFESFFLKIKNRF